VGISRWLDLQRTLARDFQNDGNFNQIPPLASRFSCHFHLQRIVSSMQFFIFGKLKIIYAVACTLGRRSKWVLPDIFSNCKVFFTKKVACCMPPFMIFTFVCTTTSAAWKTLIFPFVRFVQSRGKLFLISSKVMWSIKIHWILSEFLTSYRAKLTLSLFLLLSFVKGCFTLLHYLPCHLQLEKMLRLQEQWKFFHLPPLSSRCLFVLLQKCLQFNQNDKKRAN